MPKGNYLIKRVIKQCQPCVDLDIFKMSRKNKAKFYGNNTWPATRDYTSLYYELQISLIRMRRLETRCLIRMKPDR